MLIMPLLGELGQENHKFEIRMGYIIRLYLKIIKQKVL